MECYPSYETANNVVFTVHWGLTGTDEEYSSYVYGVTSIPLDGLDDNFTPYEDLTEEQVIGWVLDTLGEESVASHENTIASAIAEQKSPKTISPALPW